jgi:hypothetical protein
MDHANSCNGSRTFRNSSVLVRVDEFQNRWFHVIGDNKFLSNFRDTSVSEIGLKPFFGFFTIFVFGKGVISAIFQVVGTRCSRYEVSR